MPDLLEYPVLRSYLSSVRNWHGYIRFLGLRDLRDNPDLVIDRLFVDPLLTRRHVSPDENPARWIEEAETMTSILALGRPLVILGDPGAGKSTLVNYVVWLMSRPGRNDLVDRVGWRLPVPMVLRELKLQGVDDFDQLIRAFLDHAVSESLRESDYLGKCLVEGRALVVLDGVDEIGGRVARENLRQAVLDGLDRYPGCSWVVTSRIVGYSEAPFDVETFKGELRTEVRDAEGGGDEGGIVTRYIAPFDDQRISAFARRWYVQRVAGAKRAEGAAADLVRAIQEDPAILRLARVPNLLTMMALIHRVEATLPHGRALLYDRIAEAYLESIDKYRDIYSGAADLPRKKSWLARVAYEMQCLRVGQERSRVSDILVDGDQVRQWLDEAIAHSGSASGVDSSSEFLDYVGRRSGLFLPRGEGKYAFVHLSFQEYFAAVAMEREVTSLEWARNGRSALGLERGAASKLGRQSLWRETLVFLYELLATKEDWHHDYLNCVFGTEFEDVDSGESDEEGWLGLALLLARLIVDRQSGLSERKRMTALSKCVRAQLRCGQESWSMDSLPDVFDGLLVADERWNRRVLETIVRESKSLAIRAINLANTSVAELEPIEALEDLEMLNLSETHVADVRPLRSNLTLRWLDLSGTSVSDVKALGGLLRLSYLSLARTPVSDIGPLANLSGLRTLYLWRSKVKEIEALAGLSGLRDLSLINAKISDLRPLSGLKYLKELLLGGEEIAEIGALGYLSGLEKLYLADTAVQDFSPLAELVSLKELIVRGNNVVDLSAVGALSRLEFFQVSGGVMDVGPVRRLGTLKFLSIYGTRVRDLSAVKQMGWLRGLELGEEFSDAEVESVREALPRCKVGRAGRVRAIYGKE